MEKHPDFFRKARREWIEASQFVLATDPELQDEVHRRVLEAKSREPWVLFDLDSTLFEVQPRTEVILREWLQSTEAGRWPSLRERLGRVESHHLGYSLLDTWQALGVDPEENLEVKEAWQAARKHWARYFFSNEYLIHDRPYPGSAAFVRRLRDAGAGIAYLTGREEESMAEGTRLQLVREGFPWAPPATRLLMKPRGGPADAEYKREAARRFVRSQGACVIASFENEPPNTAVLQEEFPEAMHVFVDTHCSDRPAAVCVNLYRLRHFG